MTTNQTIDGVLVSRELLERIISHCKFWRDHPYLEAIQDIDKELRVLLDATAECRCKRYGKGNPHWPCPVHAAQADQPQGEPVAEIVSKYGDPEAFGERELITLKDISKFPYGTKLYADQPAPVAVVLPPKLKSPAFKTVDRGSVNYAAGLNAYANELKRLNHSL